MSAEETSVKIALDDVTLNNDGSVLIKNPPAALTEAIKKAKVDKRPVLPGEDPPPPPPIRIIWTF